MRVFCYRCEKCDRLFEVNAGDKPRCSNCGSNEARRDYRAEAAGVIIPSGFGSKVVEPPKEAPQRESYMPKLRTEKNDRPLRGTKETRWQALRKAAR